MGIVEGDLTSIKSILKLIRFKNVLIGSITVLTGSYVTLNNDWNIELASNVIFQMISVAGFMAAGNILNDITDIEIDKISHPLRVLPAGKISMSQAWALTLIFSIISITSMIYGAVKLNSLQLDWVPLVIIWIVAFTLMITYEIGPKTKQYGLLGNIIIGGLLGLVIIYGAASVGKYDNSITFFMALMATFIGISREIVKDVHDIEGDLKWGRKTLPMKIGEQGSRNLAYVFVMLGLISTMLPFTLEWGGLEYWMIVFQGPTMFCLVRLNEPLRFGNDKKAISSLLNSLIFGLIGFLSLAIVLEHLI